VSHSLPRRPRFSEIFSALLGGLAAWRRKTNHAGSTRGERPRLDCLSPRSDSRLGKSCYKRAAKMSKSLLSKLDTGCGIKEGLGVRGQRAVSFQRSAISFCLSVFSGQFAEIARERLFAADVHPSSFILHPSSFILHPSSFCLHPSAFSPLPAPRSPLQLQHSTPVALHNKWFANDQP
jgi:hypothetical protein